MRKQSFVLVPVTTRSREKMLRVDVGAYQAGLITKYPSSRTETNPWKAFRGVGWKCTYLRSFFEEDGGKAAAIQAVLAS